MPAKVLRVGKRLPLEGYMFHASLDFEGIQRGIGAYPRLEICQQTIFLKLLGRIIMLDAGRSI